MTIHRLLISKSREREGKDSRTSNGTVVIGSLILTNDRINRPLQIRRNIRLASVNSDRRDVESAEQDEELARSGLGAVVFERYSGGVGGLVGCESWESFDGKSWVGGGARVGHDEGCSEGVDLIEGLGSVEGTRPGIGLKSNGVNPSIVASLGGQDRSSGSQVRRGVQKLSSTEVSGNTDTLKYLRDGDKVFNGLDRERIFAGLSRSASQSGLEELDMLRLMLSNLVDPSTNIVGESSIAEVGSRELAEILSVERTLEMLEGESVVENLNLSRVGPFEKLVDGSGIGEGGDGYESEERCERELHCDSSSRFGRVRRLMVDGLGESGRSAHPRPGPVFIPARERGDPSSN